MRWPKTILREVYGLFVDDGRFALAILVWLGLAWGLLPRLALGRWGAIVWFAGLLAIFVESVLRRARRGE
jgi:hypothetical protein